MALLGIIFELMCIFILIPTGELRTINQTCSEDRDCYQDNTFCYQTGLCVACTDCSLYNRNSKPGCAKNKDECGDCVSGMETKFNSDKTFVCTPIFEPEEPKNKDYDVLTIIQPIIICSVILLVITTIYCLFKCQNPICIKIRTYFTVNFNNCLVNPEQSSPPPPYSVKCPSAPTFEDAPKPPDPYIYQSVLRPIEHDTNQNATAFVNPEYVVGGTFGANPNLTDHEDETEPLENQNLISQLTVQNIDEETQPSSWSPDSRYETRSGDPITFTNALNLSQLTISQPDVSTVTARLSPQQPRTSNSSNRPNCQNTIEFSNQNTSNNNENRNTNSQQINIIAHVGPVVINPSVSK